MVERLLPDQRRRAHRGDPLGPGRPERGPVRPGPGPAAPGPRHAAPDALLRHPAQPRAHPGGLLRQRHPRVRLSRPLPRRLPHQGQPAAPRGRGAGGLRPALRPRPRGRLQARAPGRAGPARQPRLAAGAQRLQGRGLRGDRAAVAEARALPDRGDRPLSRVRAVAPGGHAPWNPAPHRRPRQADHARSRQVDGIDRRPLQVRADRDRDRAPGRQAARGADAGLPRARALPHRVPDLRGARDQGRDDGSVPDLRRAGQGGSGAQVPRRGRRARGGL